MLKRIIYAATLCASLAASLLPSVAHSWAYETYIERRNASNSQTVPLTIPVPIADAIYYYDKSTFWPRLILIGPTLQISGGYINCVVPTLLSQLTNDAGYLTSVPHHDHDAADITTGVFPDFLIPAIEIWKVNGLQDALDAKAGAGDPVAWSTVTGFTGVTSVNTHTGAVTLSYSDVGAAAASHTHTLSAITDAGTSAALNVATSGDASASQVVKGNDSRLSDSRAPTAHTHTASQVTDFNAAADARVTAGISGKANVVGAPTSRTVSLATAYQCTDTSRPCTVTLTVSCPLSVTILAGATCSGESRIGSSNSVATGGGTNIAPIQRNSSGVVGLGTNDYETKTIRVPVGWYFAIRQTAGTLNIISVFDQSE